MFYPINTKHVRSYRQIYHTYLIRCKNCANLHHFTHSIIAVHYLNHSLINLQNSFKLRWMTPPTCNCSMY